MKIGILTFHEIYNPGAYLQAYSTLLLLRELGHDAHVINYTAPNHRFRPWKRLITRPHSVLRHPRTWIDCFIRNNAFTNVQSKLQPSRKFKTHSDLASEHFDAIIVGSDIVWNYQSSQWGDDTAYFGHDLNCDTLIAYAASCGPLDLNLPTPDFVIEGLRLFDAISVRDENTAEMVKAQTGAMPEIIIDPTFHLDISAITLPPSKHPEPYILVYAIPSVLSPSAIDAVTTYARQNSLKIISICYRNDWADINLMGANPFDWLSYISNASYVFTNTFHGTIFSIKLRKQFATELNKLITSKTQPMLTKLNLLDRVYSANASLDSILASEPDYASISNNMNSYAETNISFLTNSLYRPYRLMLYENFTSQYI